MTGLKAVKTASPVMLSPSQAAETFARKLIADGYCVDISAFPPKPIQYGKAKAEMIDSFRWMFINWRKANGIRVNTNNYGQFLTGFVERLMPLLPRVHGSGFNPAVGPIYTNNNGVQLANTFIPFRPECPGVFVMPEILQEYFNRVLPVPAEQKLVLQFLAHLIQHPEIRTQWMLVLHGEQGTGKSLLYEMIAMALGGNHHWDDNSYAPLDEKFGDIIATNLFLHFDDAPVGDKTYAKLKHNVTRNYKSHAVKNVQARAKAPVYARMMVSFNIEERPFLHEPGCRRTYYPAPCMHAHKSAEESAEFFSRFHAQFLSKPEAPAILYHLFSTLDVSDFSVGSCPQTETYHRMTSNGTTVLDDLLKQYTKESSIFHIATLYDFLKLNGITYPDRVIDKIKQTLGKLNYETSVRPVTGCGRNISLLQPKAKRSRSLSEGEIEAIQTALHCKF